MKRHFWPIVYIALHAIVFGAMFLPPLWIPNHGNGNGYEYHIWLAGLFLYGSLAMGFLAAFFPVSWKIRLIAAATMLMGSIHCGISILFYVIIYAVCLLITRFVIWMLCSTAADYREYRKRNKDAPRS